MDKKASVSPLHGGLFSSFYTNIESDPHVFNFRTIVHSVASPPGLPGKTLHNMAILAAICRALLCFFDFILDFGIQNVHNEGIIPRKEDA
jgi:hypothetical protein